MIGFGDDERQPATGSGHGLAASGDGSRMRRLEEIGEAFDRLALRSQQLSDLDPDLRVAIEFLDGWYDSSNHGWQFYEPLGQYDWPRLSLSLAASLEADEPIDEAVKQRFTFAPRRGLWSRIREVFRGSA